jgi:hypothetical protein
LTDGSNCSYGRIIKQHTTLAIEHKIEETSESTGETCLPWETHEQVAIHKPMVKTSFEVFSKGREGNREKRFPFVFGPPRDIFDVTSGACAALPSQFIG